MSRIPTTRDVVTPLTGSPFTPTSGQFAAATLGTGTGGAPSTTNPLIPGINWSLNFTSNPKDVSNFRDGRRRWGTLADYSLTVTLIWDSAANPTIAANGTIFPGQHLNMTLFTDQAQTVTKAWVGPVIVSTVVPKNPGMEDVVQMDVTCDADGAITPPSA